MGDQTECRELQKGSLSDLLHLDKCQSHLLWQWLIAAKSVMLLGPAASMKHASDDLYSVLYANKNTVLGLLTS